jgi:hypothetical protein
MGIQASRPGDAEVTLTNLESFFSDLSSSRLQEPKTRGLRSVRQRGSLGDPENRKATWKRTLVTNI